MTEKGWLRKVLDEADEDVKTLPEWLTSREEKSSNSKNGKTSGASGKSVKNDDETED